MSLDKKLMFNWLNSGGGASYYVASAGSGVGTQDDPFGVSEFLAALSTIPAGSTINFNKGDTFEIGDIDADKALTFDAYGTGADPILKGSTDISGLVWTDEGGGVYSTPMATDPKWIWIDGVCAKLAETPRITITSRPSITSIGVSHGDVSGYTNIVGSSLVMKVKKFQMSQRVTVTGYNGAGTITIDGSIVQTSNVDLVLLNDTEYFDGDNEWVWRSNVLYVKAAASPATLNIRKGIYDHCIEATNSSGTVTVQNLDIGEYWQHGVHSISGKINVNNCSIHDIRDAGVTMKRQLTGASITYNTFDRIGAAGTFSVPNINTVISNNTFTDIGMQANYGWPTWAYDTGAYVVRNCAITTVSTDVDNISQVGDANEFNYNTITNIAYCGLQARSSNDVIRGNIISNFLNRLIDGGGIYTYHYKGGSDVSQNIEINNNIVYDDGPNTTEGESVGIYCDERTQAANVHHNVVYDCTWGILLNGNTSDHTVEDNITRDCVAGIVFRAWDNGDLFPDNENNQCNRNVMIMVSASQYGFKFPIVSGSYSNDWNPFQGTGGSDNNRFIQPYTTPIANNPGGNMTLAQLQSTYGEDASSSAIVSTNNANFDNAEVYKLITNETESDVAGTTGSATNDKDGNAITSYTIPAKYGIVLVSDRTRDYSTYSGLFAKASTQYITVGTAADIQRDYTDAFSLSFWFKTSNTTTGQVLISRDQGSTPRGFYVTMGTTGFPTVQLTNTATTNRAQYIDDSGGARNDGVWRHLLFVKGTTIASGKVYINGSIAQTGADADNLVSTILNGNDFAIAAHPDGSFPYDGNLAHIAWWNVNLDGLQSAIYNSGRTLDYMTLTNKPVHYWRMNDDAWVDVGSSSNKLNGTPVNSPVFSADVP